MQFLKTAAVLAALAAGALGMASAPASATPLSAGAASALATEVDEGLVTQVQSGFTPRHRRYHHRRGYGPRYRYVPRHYYHRPRVVCRTELTPWGPRRVCYRR